MHLLNPRSMGPVLDRRPRVRSGEKRAALAEGLTVVSREESVLTNRSSSITVIILLETAATT